MKGEKWLAWFRRGPSATWELAAEAESCSQASKRLTAWLKERGIRLVSNLDRCLTRGSYPDIGARRD